MHIITIFSNKKVISNEARKIDKSFTYHYIYSLKKSYFKLYKTKQIKIINNYIVIISSNKKNYFKLYKTKQERLTSKIKIINDYISLHIFFKKNHFKLYKTKQIKIINN